MIVEKEIEIFINSRNITFYRNKGYNPITQGDIIKVKIEDLNTNCKKTITAVCDCGNQTELRYEKYIINKNRGGYYGCRKCSRKKAVKTSQKLYGVDNYMQTDECKEKVAENNLKKYGVKTTLLEKNTKEKIKKTIISGVKGISHVIVANRGREFVVLTAGSNLKDIMDIKGIDKKRLTTNNLHEISDVLGIEAARQLIINEIHDVLKTQGLDVDQRHLKLIADAMAATGEIKGVTRMGIIAQKSSVLARATFETTDKQFVNATIKGSKDVLSSVIENILLNQAVPIGTGLPGLLAKVIGPLIKKDSEKKVVTNIKKG